MENNALAQLYIDKIFDELNETLKQKILLLATNEANKQDFKLFEEDHQRTVLRVSELENRIIELENEVQSKQNLIESSNSKLNKLMLQNNDIGENEKTNLLNQIADLNERLRISKNSNEYLIRAVKDKDNKIIELSKKNQAAPSKKTKKTIQVTKAI